MKYCEEYEALLDLFVDGELSAEDMIRVQAHLNTCPGCQAYVDDALAIRAAFPTVEDTPVPNGFADGVMAAVRQAASAERKSRPSPWKKALLPMAACFAVVLLALPIWQSGSMKSSAPAETAALQSLAEDGEAELKVARDIGPQDQVCGNEPETAPAGQAPAASTEAAAPQSLAEEPVHDEAEPKVTQNTTSQGHTDGSPESTPENQTPMAPAAPSTSPAEAQDPGGEPGESYDMAESETSSEVVPFATLTLTADEAGSLLAELTPVEESETQLEYHLTQAEYAALLAALPETVIEPASGGEPFDEAEDTYALIIVILES